LSCGWGHERTSGGGTARREETGSHEGGGGERRVGGKRGEDWKGTGATNKHRAAWWFTEV